MHVERATAWVDAARLETDEQLQETWEPGRNPTNRKVAATMLRTPLGRRVKVIEHGTGARWCSSTAGWAALASGSSCFCSGRRATGSSPSRPTATAPAQAGEGGGASTTTRIRSTPSPSTSSRRSRWSGSRGAAQPALRVASAAPELVDSLAVIEPEAYALLRTQDTDAYTQICDLRDRWRAHVRAGQWYEAFEDFIDFYNGPGSFARWPRVRREAFLAVQKARADLWDVLFDDSRLSTEALARVTAPVHVLEGSQTSGVDRAICDVVRRHMPHAQHTMIEGAGHMIPLTHPKPLTRALLTRIER